MGDPIEKKLVIDSSFEAINKLEPFLKELQDETGLGDDHFSRIRLAVNEAVTNAITHGNEQDPSKKVRVYAIADNHQLKVNVKDEGPGFNPNNLDDPLKEENLLKESGRGIFLIKANADEVQFTENATNIIMLFELSGD